MSVSQPDLTSILRQGVAAAQSGQFAVAEQHYRTALALAPQDPRIALGLGQILRQLRRTDEARALFADVAARHPELAQVHHALGLVCQDAGDTVGAEAGFRAALERDARLLPAALSLAALYNAAQKPNAALALLADAQTADPAMDAAIAHARALAQQGLGQHEAALANLRHVVRVQPANMAAHHNLNQLLYRLARDEEFLRSYDEAAARLPGQPHFALAKAAHLVRLDRAGEALPLYQQVLKLAPGAPMVLQGLAMAQFRLGQAREAIASYEAGLAQAPQDVNMLSGLAAACLVARDSGKAQDAALRALAVAPHDQTSLGMLATAWRLLGDAREHDFCRYDDFVQMFDLDAPPGFADMAEFCAALDAWLGGQHRDVREYLDQSLRGGTQTTGALFDIDHELVAALRSRIEAAVRDYIAALPDDPRHPFTGRKARDFRFAGSWSSRLRDRGFHANHLHPEGWISSAFYVAVPDVAANAQDKQGWLKFGEPGYEVGLTDPVRRYVQPRVGRLVLFPSYLWHGTVPFHAAQDRTTVAFDGVPRP